MTLFYIAACPISNDTLIWATMSTIWAFSSLTSVIFSIVSAADKRGHFCKEIISFQKQNVSSILRWPLCIRHSTQTDIHLNWLVSNIKRLSRNLYFFYTYLERVVFPAPETPMRRRCPWGCLNILSILRTWSSTSLNRTRGTSSSSS